MIATIVVPYKFVQQKGLGENDGKRVTTAYILGNRGWHPGPVNKNPPLLAKQFPGQHRCVLSHIRPGIQDDNILIELHRSGSRVL